MTDNSGKILKSIHPARIVLPILIGIAVTGFMLYREYQPGSLSLLSFTLQSVFWLFLAFVMMGIRDLGYIIRLRILTQNKLSWRKTFNIVMLWEFTSAITPSAIGGTSVAIFFINKEGISLGRSTAVVMVTSFLDELYFILTFPVILLLIGRTDIFSLNPEEVAIPWYQNQFLIFALVGYSLKLLYTLVISYGLFINPRGLKWILLWIFKLPIIKKWRPQANESGTELIQTSKEFRNWPFSKWLQAFVATFFSWTARYWVVNALILTFFGMHWLSWSDHILVFGKQLVMWIMMLVSPTPGGSGFAEYVFRGFLAAFIPLGTGVAMAFLWRLISYYPYLFIGAFVIPKWVKKHFVSRKA
ncbi:lysylphosphatidylglycerol synthase transmembrane domain-containing protein [Alkaliflexus imshenetskii]|uniref:lysylphosphatidylglycerol synthase transmembrane domain-containing protein n=1 Tax=Alkaliflexus imshenetskii TaxID=286730 RepID=UPI0004789475|nr:lysylphosphatidylglycerol synthase transmembrane domain-containing protein [Alkaliflexus imshenetskii]